MIYTKEELLYYMEEDRKVYHKQEIYSIKGKVINLIFKDHFFEYMKCLRKLEYYSNRKKVGRYYYAYKLGKLKQKTGIDLAPNVAGAGLHLPHGKVVINPKAKIGEHCKILSDVTIGVLGSHRASGAPRIGNRVFIGSGARIIGDIEIADDIVIGANAVVTKNFFECGITIAGVPARKICNNGSQMFCD